MLNPVFVLHESHGYLYEDFGKWELTSDVGIEFRENP